MLYEFRFNASYRTAQSATTYNQLFEVKLTYGRSCPSGPFRLTVCHYFLKGRGGKLHFQAHIRAFVIFFSLPRKVYQWQPTIMQCLKEDISLFFFCFLYLYISLSFSLSIHLYIYLSIFLSFSFSPSLIEFLLHQRGQQRGWDINKSVVIHMQKQGYLLCSFSKFYRYLEKFKK